MRPLYRLNALLCLSLFGCGGSIDYVSSASPSSAPVSTPSGSTGCVPGMQVSCPCPNQRMGVAACDSRGQLGACSCPPAPTMAGSTFEPSPMTPGAPLGTPGSATSLPPDSADPMPAPMSPAMTSPAAGVKIATLAWYQPVKTPLVEKGAEVTERIAPVIASKRALLRVFVETLPGFTARDLSATLTLSAADGSSDPLVTTAHIGGNSTDADLKSSLNFDVPAERVLEDTRYSVVINEAAGATAQAGAAIDPDVRWPKQSGELAELGARNPGIFRVVVIPYRYQADNSGRLPVTDDKEMAAYEAYLRASYPTTDIQLEVHEPVDFKQSIGQEQGWAEWLDSHCALRKKEAPDPKVFYYGMIQPKASWREYGGGVVGISNLPGPAANYGRCSVGIGYAGFAFVAAHELGHALGLEHAPCGTGGDAGPFPYKNASTGVWGYDVLTSKLMDPAKAHDLMSYCDPPFMSDYNYRRLFSRIRYLNVQFDVVEPAPTMYRRVLIDETGAARVRDSMAFGLPPGGPEEMRSITQLDSTGAPIGQSDAFFIPFSLGRAGVWFIPDSGTAAVRLDGVGDVRLD